MEAPPGFGPGNRGFAVHCLTTWLWRRGVRRNSLHFVSAAGLCPLAKTPYPLLPSSFPKRTRCAGLRFGEGILRGKPVAFRFRHKRRKLHIHRFLLPFPKRTRCAGLRFGGGWGRGLKARLIKYMLQSSLWSIYFWSGLRGSNSLPPPWQGGALPDELRPQIGASGQNRTGDTRIFSPLLYQLSYRGILRKRVVETTGLGPATPCL